MLRSVAGEDGSLTLFSDYYDATGTKKHSASFRLSSSTDGSSLLFDADQINFIGKTVINNKFVVDDKGNVTMDGLTANNATIKGKIEASKGQIAGFRIVGEGLTNSDFDNDAYIIFQNSSRKSFAGIGGNVLPPSTGGRAVARFENHDDRDKTNHGLNVAMIVSAKGALAGDDQQGNCAIRVLGGYIAGFGLKTKVIGYNTLRENAGNELRKLDVKLNTDVGCVLASTQFYYDYMDKGELKTDTKYRDVTITMPDVSDAEEGKMIWIKRSSGDRGELSLVSGTYRYDSYENYTWAKKNAPTYFMIDRAETVTEVSFAAGGDAMCFVFFPTMQLERDGKTYRGCWVQWKAPRDW